LEASEVPYLQDRGVIVDLIEHGHPDHYLDTEIETISAQQAETFKVLENRFRFMLSKACREAHLAEVVACARLLDSRTVVKSP
jgi:hypothetical protein